MFMRRKLAALSAGVLVILGGGAYLAYDYYAGNHVAIQEVIPADAPVEAAAGPVDAEQLNGDWSLASDSKVYFSVTTSKETVNFEGSSVKGNWQLDTSDPAKVSAEAVLDVNTLQSGNSQRDGHVKGTRFLDAEQFPEAKFTVKTFDNLPAEWKEGEQVAFKMTGTLTVKGISKDVTFDSKAVYNQGAISMEGSSVVTFNDFGMENPHTVLLDTENNITVELRLILEKASDSV
jgi:polyisoprenoid-binding protein YceI